MALSTLPFVMALTACVATGNHGAPESAQRQWQSSDAPAEWRALAVSGPSDAGAANLDHSREYDLPALIDLAQRNSPDTRLAWSQARQAASAVGIADATFLPMLSAHVVGGYVSTRNQLPEILGQRPHVDTSSSGVVPLATLQWLLFDFGQRSALRDSARSLSLGANFLYNGAHQKLIYSVMSTYYEHDAARQRSEIAKASLRNSESVLAAVEARRRNGMATTIELAQVRQLVAQARLRVVTAQGAERNTYQALAAAAGVDPTATLRIAPLARRPLPPAADVASQEILHQALADRPDVMASVAALKAAEHSVDAAKADFLPKVYLAGFAAAGNRNLDVGNLPILAGQSNANGVIVGISVPIFDGGLRSARLQDANERVQASQAALSKLRMEAMRQIVVASTTLESALQANEAAISLESAASLTYDAALDAYQHGVGTVTAATEAANGLLAARSARADAYSAAMTGAATLAFSLGRINAESGQ
ncbi:TolC family protein [Achromobacter seleniivolatilans]|uniref:Protein CyaE n=1 Tax=Achromobacter seleniivolatilans TaxID=3047478 RepID=A0ABY9LZU6_9BURK|nr:TolC family protein [Achromobacter sp. R39]WMD20225.1 TolC family protein [Achromobacter sp. R39]